MSTATVSRRQLDFKDVGEAIPEVERLHTGGYARAGQWNLAQVCDHLSYFIEGSLDGHTFQVPWLLRTVLGRLVLKRILSTRRMKERVTTPQRPLPEPDGDEEAAVARLKRAIQRLRTHQGELHASPFFGYLTPEQWRELHAIHCAHHLSFLVPKSC